MTSKYFVPLSFPLLRAYLIVFIREIFAECFKNKLESKLEWIVGRERERERNFWWRKPDLIASEKEINSSSTKTTTTRENMSTSLPDVKLDCHAVEQHINKSCTSLPREKQENCCFHLFFSLAGSADPCSPFSLLSLALRVIYPWKLRKKHIFSPRSRSRTFPSCSSLSLTFSLISMRKTFSFATRLFPPAKNEELFTFSFSTHIFFLHPRDTQGGIVSCLNVIQIFCFSRKKNKSCSALLRSSHRRYPKYKSSERSSFSSQFSLGRCFDDTSHNFSFRSRENIFKRAEQSEKFQGGRGTYQTTFTFKVEF